MKKSVSSELEMRELGASIGQLLRGGETLELVGDVGAGKTTFVKGLARGLGIDEDVQSPSFTISRVYDARDGLVLAHYDFYRLGEAGILSEDLQESMNDPRGITVIEWAGIVTDVLPADRIRIEFRSISEGERELTIEAPQVIAEGLA